MSREVETITELLKENAERFHSLAKDDPLRAESLEAQALKCEKLIDKITSSASAARKVKGPWIFCPKWIYPDLPQWAEEPDDNRNTLAIELQSLRPLLTEALSVVRTERTDPDGDGSWEVTEEDVKTARFSQLAFLPGVILAHLTKQMAGEDARESWIAFFNITKDPNGSYTARSFDFKAGELHRLNTSVPLQLVGHELEYLRYFMYVVRGDAGAFRLLEGEILTRAQELLEDEQLARKGQLTKARPETDNVLAALATMGNLFPTHFLRVTTGGGIIFLSNILYSATMFSAELLVNPDGTVEMRNDLPLSNDEVEGLGE